MEMAERAVNITLWGKYNGLGPMWRRQLSMHNVAFRRRSVSCHAVERR